MKTFRRIISLVLISLFALSALAACTSSKEGTEQQSSSSPEPPEETTTLQGEETSDPASNETSTDAVTTEKEPTVQIPSSIKILAIGNSFSTDGMQYLCQMLKDAGVKNVILGNLYYGGCTLAQHLTYGKNDSTSYTYYKTTSGSWSSTGSYKMSAALVDEEWDYISFQQSSKTSGLISSYATLADLTSFVREKCPNAKFIWHMTWAYQQDSTHSSFPNYDKDQIKMYNMIVDTVKQKIVTDDQFKIIIPCGTAVQNARTSFMGDTLTRDGYHMDYNIGRYILGLTWCAAITGADVDKITYNPSPSAITADMVKAAKEAVKNAITKPYEVTQSTVISGEGPAKATTPDPSITLNPQDFYEQDKALANSNGVDLSKYTLLEWTHLNNTYWNCTSRAGVTTPNTSASTYNQNVCSNRKYSLTELPFGTIFICDEGWQYRLDIFPNATSKYTGTRPGMITDNYFVLSANHMKDCTYMGWNIASNPKKDISSIFSQAAAHLRIYVPNVQ